MLEVLCLLPSLQTGFTCSRLDHSFRWLDCVTKAGIKQLYCTAAAAVLRHVPRIQLILHAVLQSSALKSGSSRLSLRCSSADTAAASCFGLVVWLLTDYNKAQYI
jgi:hypothetical protein